MAGGHGAGLSSENWIGVAGRGIQECAVGSTLNSISPVRHRAHSVSTEFRRRPHISPLPALEAILPEIYLPFTIHASGGRDDVSFGMALREF